MDNLNLKIGDKVIRNYTRIHGGAIGVVTNITKKRGDIVVDYGNYKEIYKPDGWQRSNDIWGRSFIRLLTPEIKEEIRQVRLIRKCRDVFEKKDLSAEQAEKILEILNDAEPGE